MVPLPLAVVTAAVQVGADAAFFVVFGLFVAAFVVLAVVTLRWAVRRDRGGRDEWLERQQPRPEFSRDAASPTGNGRGSTNARGQSPGEPR